MRRIVLALTLLGVLLNAAPAAAENTWTVEPYLAGGLRAYDFGGSPAPGVLGGGVSVARDGLHLGLSYLGTVGVIDQSHGKYVRRMHSLGLVGGYRWTFGSVRIGPQVQVGMQRLDLRDSGDPRAQPYVTPASTLPSANSVYIEPAFAVDLVARSMFVGVEGRYRWLPDTTKAFALLRLGLMFE